MDHSMIDEDSMSSHSKRSRRAMSEESDKSAQPSKRARVQPESEDERKTKNTEPGSYASRPLCRYPENASHSPIAGSMLGQRRRRWANIDPALGQ